MTTFLTILGLSSLVGLLVFAFKDEQSPSSPSKQYRELRDTSTGKVHVKELRDERSDTAGRPDRPAG